MGYSTDYRFYPPEMGEAVEKAFSMQTDLHFEAPSAQRAAAIRGQFYAYFRALRRAVDRNLPQTEHETVRRLLDKASQLSVYAEGSKVILTLKSNTPEMVELRRTLAEGVDRNE